MMITDEEHVFNIGMSCWDKNSPGDFESDTELTKKKLKAFASNKNEWIKDALPCKDLYIDNVQSDCYYYDLFDVPNI